MFSLHGHQTLQDGLHVAPADTYLYLLKTNQHLNKTTQKAMIIHMSNIMN